MARGDVVRIGKFNNIVIKLKIARDKYYSGYEISSEINSGTSLTANKTNQLFTECSNVSAKSPKVYSFEKVTQGALIQEEIFNTTLTNIEAVATCYSNCHSDCHSNSGGGGDRGRCPD